MRNPTNEKEAFEMIEELETKNSAPDLAQEQIDEINADIERIKQWLLQQSA